MQCARVRMLDGTVAIVSGNFPRLVTCRTCGIVAAYLCDWRLPGGKTCDAPICGVHAFEAEPEKHLCPRHQLAYRAWLVQQCIALA